jgi:tRNA G37 N-methylase Trm5
MLSTVTVPGLPLTELTHQLLQKHVQEGDCVLDATAGNGHDSLFLLDLVKTKGRIFSFDIQQAALDATRKLTQRHPDADRIECIHASHVFMERHIPEEFIGAISAVVFNLGYLPGSDKSIITRTSSTLEALDAACRVICTGGVIAVMAYPGHAGGDQEAAAVKQWCEEREYPQFQITLYLNRPENPAAPMLFFLRKSGR